MLFLDYTPDLTETDMIIYQTIIKNMNAIIYMRIRDLARETYCSTASIQRFCQKFDCSGWAEFKTKLRMYIEEKGLRQTLSSELDSSEIVHSIMETDAIESQRKIKDAAELMAHRKQVIWFGCGTSRIIAEFGAVTYSSLVNISLAITDPLNNPIVSFNDEISKNTCVVVCSVSGENRMVINYIDELLKNNVPVISISNSYESAISKMSTIGLNYFATVQEVAGANVTTQTPAVFLVEKLIRKASSITNGTENDDQDNIR